MWRALLGRLTDDSLAESIVGDLEELRRQQTRRSDSHARAWYVMAMAAIVGTIFLSNLRQSARSVFPPGRGRSPRAEMRHAFRSLRAAPWYSAAVLIVIALSMSLSATVFAIVDGVLFNAMPYPAADRLYAIAAWNAKEAEPVRSLSAVSEADVRAWSDAVSPDQIAAFSGNSIQLMGENEFARSAAVDERFFTVLGQAPLVGGFEPRHFVATTPIQPALLSHAFWRRRFNGDAAVLGRTFTDRRGEGIQVVGILPPDFVFPHWGGAPPLLLTPLVPAPAAVPSEGRSDWTIVRLSAGRSVVETQSRLIAAARTRAAALPAPEPGSAARWRSPFERIRLDAIRTALIGPVRAISWTVFAIAASLLMLACLNVTGLGIARLSDRTRDLELRRAIGASSADLARLLLVENGLIVVVGAALGLGLASPALDLTMAVMPGLMLIKAPAIDLRVMGFAALASALCLVAVTLWPARAVARASLRASLAEAGGTTRRARRGRTLLVGAQVALAFVMIVGGAMLVGSLMRVWNNDSGFEADRRALVSMSMPEGTSGADQEGLMAHLRRHPGIEHAGGLDGGLMGNSFNGSSFDTPAGVVEETIIESISVTTGFLETAGLIPVEGRLPSADEFAQGAPVAVVSEIVARQYWPGRAAVNQMLVWNKRPFRVIGVVPDARYVALDRPPQGAIYSPLLADPRPGLSTVLYATKPGSTIGVTEVIDHLKTTCPTCRFRHAETLTQAMGMSIRMRQFRAWLFAAFGVAALVIVGIGILGLVAMTTSRRTKEVGIRMTVGASRADVLRLLVREQTHGVVLGLAAGGLVAAWAVRFVSAYVYETPLHDPLIWSASILMLLAIALAGTLIPAVRASRVDPVKALRVE